MGNPNNRQNQQKSGTNQTNQNNAGVSSAAPAPSAAAPAPTPNANDIEIEGSGTDQQNKSSGDAAQSGTDNKDAGAADPAVVKNQQSSETSAPAPAAAAPAPAEPPAAPAPSPAPAPPTSANTQPKPSVAENTTNEVQQTEETSKPTGHDGLIYSAQEAAAGAPEAISQMALTAVVEYLNDLHPTKRATDAARAIAQRNLYRAIVLAIDKTTDEGFQYAWSRLLSLFKEGADSVFSEVEIFRSMESIELSLKERENFQRLVQLARLTADRKGWGVILTQLDMTKVTEYLPNEAARERIRSFYQK